MTDKINIMCTGGERANLIGSCLQVATHGDYGRTILFINYSFAAVFSGKFSIAN